MKFLRTTKIIAIVFCLMVVTSTMVFATTTLMTYSGTDIRNKASLQNFTLSKQTDITVKHRTVAVKGVDGYTGTVKLTIYLQKKNSLGLYKNTGDSFYLKGTQPQSKDKTWTKGSGTYRLLFSSYKEDYQGALWPAFDIKGSVIK